MDTQEIIRPKISLLNEESYVASICELGFYFIEKYPKFFGRISQNDTDQFELRVSSQKNEIPFTEEMKKNETLVIIACKTMHVGWNSFQYDSHITIQIVENFPISIAFMHKISWKDQVTIYFTDNSAKGVKTPGQEEEFYDPAVLTQSPRKFFMETVGFATETTTTIEKALDTLEKVLRRLEDNP